jgi:holo-[acyl-carrier protein] synthase
MRETIYMTAPMIGIDLVDPVRLNARLERTPDLMTELFHEGEVRYSDSQSSPIESLAARFAAKEAVVKALGIDGFDPLDVEVIRGGDECAVALHGTAAKRAEQLGVAVTISLSHLPTLATAVALAQPRMTSQA